MKGDVGGDAGRRDAGRRDGAKVERGVGGGVCDVCGDVGVCVVCEDSDEFDWMMRVFGL